MKVRNYKTYNDDTFTQCSVTFQENEYLKGAQGHFTERIYMLIPTTKIPEFESYANTTFFSLE